MFTSVFKYAYPHAKVRAMKAMLLSEEHFHGLLTAETFDQLLHVLQATPYGDALQDVPPADLTTPRLTALLYKSLFRDYRKTIRSMPSALQSVFILYYQRYELINLKTILRGMISNVPPETTAGLLLPTEDYTVFSKSRLLDCHDVRDVIEELRGTLFDYPLHLALRRYDQEQEFFPLEMALDIHYYHTLWDAFKKLPNGEEIIVKELIGIVFDILNIAWIIRFKEQYHFSTEEIMNYTIQHGYAFRLAERRRLSEAQDMAELLAYLRTTPYGRMLPENVSLQTLHVLLNRQLIKHIRKFFSGDPFQIGVIFGYCLLKEFEIADILTIAEAKKYGFSLEQSQQYIIHAKAS